LTLNLRLCLYISSSTEHQHLVLDIILEILVTVNFRNVAYCDVTPQGLVDVTNRLEADFALFSVVD